MWRKPYRQTATRISQAYNDGVVVIYRAENGAAPGELPAPVLTRKAALLYEERTVGAVRYYAAKEAQQQIDRVIRVQDPGPITLPDGSKTATAPIGPQDVAETEDGVRYRIDRVTVVRDAYPRTLELTLRRFEQAQEVIA